VADVRTCGRAAAKGQFRMHTIAEAERRARGLLSGSRSDPKDHYIAVCARTSVPCSFPATHIMQVAMGFLGETCLSALSHHRQGKKLEAPSFNFWKDKRKEISYT
jgi:hypothetical protein